MSPGSAGLVFDGLNLENLFFLESKQHEVMYRTAEDIIKLNVLFTKRWGSHTQLEHLHLTTPCVTTSTGSV